MRRPDSAGASPSYVPMSIVNRGPVVAAYHDHVDIVPV